MAHSCKWLRFAADSCSHLAATWQPLAQAAAWQPLGSLLAATWQPLGSHLAATCSHLLRQPLGSHSQTLALSGCSKWLPSGCLSKWLPSGCKWLTFRKSQWCTFARSLQYPILDDPIYDSISSTFCYCLLVSVKKLNWHPTRSMTSVRGNIPGQLIAFDFWTIKNDGSYSVSQ